MRLKLKAKLIRIFRKGLFNFIKYYDKNLQEE